jgi:hypothetical protein
MRSVVPPYIAASSLARPRALSAKRPSAARSIRSSLIASSQAQLSGQVLLQACRASVTLRGRAATHFRNSIVRSFASLAMAAPSRSVRKMLADTNTACPIYDMRIIHID